MTEKAQKIKPIKQIMKQCRMLRPVYLLFLLAWMIKCAMDIIQKVVLGGSIDETRIKGVEGVIPLVAICVICMVISYLFTIGNRYFLNRCIEKHIKKLRVQAGYHLIHVPYVKIESMQRGDILSRTMGDLEKIQFFFENSISEFAITTLSGIIGLTICLITSWKLTLSVMLAIPVIMVINILTTKSMERLMMTQKNETGSGNSIAINVLQQINAVKAFNLEQLLSGKYFKQLKKIQVAENKIAYKRAALSFVQCLGSVLVYVTLMVVGGLLVINNELTPGNFVVILMLIEPLGAFAYQIQGFIYSLKECKTGSRRILDILNLQEEGEETLTEVQHDKRKLSTVERSQRKGERELLYVENDEPYINFSNVSFSYHYLREQEMKEHSVLKNINLSIKKGQKAAIVGSSGCGKSTLVKLISALYLTDEGNITIDGLPLTESTVRELRGKIAVVLQENYLFPMTIEENIRCGRPDATHEDVVEAAQKVGIHEFIMSLPDGYDTVLGEDGKTVSGGQRQRLCIARAYIKKPEILILDEPTAALDTESERIVERSLEQLMEGKTTITIAHRLSTIRNSDIIFCMEDGEIVEKGTHKQLYAQKGRYYNLYNIQQETWQESTGM